MLIYLSENSNVKRCSGFTLIEMMIVIALIAALAFFTVKYSSRKFGDQLVDRSAAETINIKRAALNHFTTVGHWPDGENNCANAAADLRKYIGQTNQNAWGYAFSYSCPEITSPAPVSDEGDEQDPIQSIPSFIIQQQAPSHKAALQLARHLPATEARVGEAAGGVVPYYVETYVPMVLMPSVQDNSTEIRQGSDGELWIVQKTCPDQRLAEIIIVPKTICASRGDQKFYGYRVGTQMNRYQRLVVYLQVLNQNNNWIDGFNACGVSRSDFADVLSIHQFCKTL